MISLRAAQGAFEAAPGHQHDSGENLKCRIDATLRTVHTQESKPIGSG